MIDAYDIEAGDAPAVVAREVQRAHERYAMTSLRQAVEPLVRLILAFVAALGGRTAREALALARRRNVELGEALERETHIESDLGLLQQQVDGIEDALDEVEDPRDGTPLAERVRRALNGEAPRPEHDGDRLDGELERLREEGAATTRVLIAAGYGCDDEHPTAARRAALDKVADMLRAQRSKGEPAEAATTAELTARADAAERACVAWEEKVRSGELVHRDDARPGVTWRQATDIALALCPGGDVAVQARAVQRIAGARPAPLTKAEALDLANAWVDSHPEDVYADELADLFVRLSAGDIPPQVRPFEMAVTAGDDAPDSVCDSCRGPIGLCQSHIRNIPDVPRSLTLCPDCSVRYPLGTVPPLPPELQPVVAAHGDEAPDSVDPSDLPPDSDEHVSFAHAGLPRRALAERLAHERAVKAATGDAPERLCVAVLVTNTVGQVLLVKSKKPGRAWELPGGRVNEGESPQAAAFREVAEETSIRLRGEVEHPTRAGKTLVFRTRADGTPVPGGDADEAEWCGPNEVLYVLTTLSPLDSRDVLLTWAREQAVEAKAAVSVAVAPGEVMMSAPVSAAAEGGQES